MIHQNPNDSSEGEEGTIFGRRITPGKILRDGGISFVKYKASQNAEFELTKELPLRDNPNEPGKKIKWLRYENALTDIPCKLKAEVIELEISGKSNLKIEVEPHTSTHKIQKILTNRYVYGKIQTPFRFIMEKLEKSKVEKAIEQKSDSKRLAHK
jgi:hypothetical protein